MLKKVLSIGGDSSRIDVAFGVYLDNSIKDMERNRRSCGELKLQQIITDAEIKQWALLSSSNDNKNKLIRFTVEHWKSNSNLINGKEFITTVDSKAHKINLNDFSLVQELQSDHAREDHDEVVIVSPDTDVFLIALSKSPLIQPHLYMLTGTGKHTRIIDIEAVAVSANEKFNKTKCNEEDFLNALLAYHCFTICDSTSSFAGRGKIKPLVELGKNKVFIDTFKNIGRILTSSEMFSSLKQFMCVMSGQRSNENLSVNDSRYNIYCQRQGKVSSSMLLPCHDVLIQHIKRVSYQTHIW